MSGKCSLCDGTIVNGRCSWCGMPERSDLTLYHLNEKREEHIRHATPEERKAIRQSTVPYPDRNQAGTTSVKPQAKTPMSAAAKKNRAKVNRSFGTAGRKKGNPLRWIVALFFILMWAVPSLVGLFRALCFRYF